MLSNELHGMTLFLDGIIYLVRGKVSIHTFPLPSYTSVIFFWGVSGRKKRITGLKEIAIRMVVGGGT